MKLRQSNTDEWIPKRIFLKNTGIARGVADYAIKSKPFLQKKEASVGDRKATLINLTEFRKLGLIN